MVQLRHNGEQSIELFELRENLELQMRDDVIWHDLILHRTIAQLNAPRQSTFGQLASTAQTIPSVVELARRGDAQTSPRHLTPKALAELPMPVDDIGPNPLPESEKSASRAEKLARRLPEASAGSRPF
jgi:hypothetical protein